MTSPPRLEWQNVTIHGLTPIHDSRPDPKPPGDRASVGHVSRNGYMTPFSILDLAPIARAAAPPRRFRNTLDLAQHAERWGYHRYWLAEHHNMPGIASAATSVVIAHVAGGTSTIRVGAGGIMLPNHSPLVIAEQFGTLESLFPGRIDLGLGRAPGTDQVTALALRRQPQRRHVSARRRRSSCVLREPAPGQRSARCRAPG